jgi:ABC-2 type transport system permease protein
MFPLDMLPYPWRSLVSMSPLQYLAYFPAAVFLGKIPPAELPQALAVQAGWVLFFVALTRVLWQRGLKRYSAYGG